MHIGKDLHRIGKFRNEHHMLAVNIHFTGLWLQEKMTVMLKAYNLTNQQYNIIRILDRQAGALTTLQIRQRMMDKMSDTSRIVDRLITKGLLSKTINRSDKRLVDIALTNKAKRLVKKLENEFDVKVDDICKLLTVQEAKILNKLLDKMRG
jgi:DNA-binding MarR family transcriptional regulator